MKDSLVDCFVYLIGFGMCAQGAQCASMEMDLGFLGADGCKKHSELVSKWHYDGALDDCVILAWEGIQFIG